MASLGDMNVKIGADLSELISKVDAAKAKLNQLTESEQQLKASINDLNSSLKQNESELGKTATQLRKLVDGGKGASAEANKLRKEIANLASNSQQLNTSLAGAKNQLAATTVQIKAQTIAAKQAETATGGFAKGATKLYSGLRTLANIIPGIGIAGLVGLISGPLIDALSDWLGLTEDVNDASKESSKTVEEMVTNYDRFVESLEQVSKTLSQEQGKVSLLFNALSDANAGLTDRKEIIDQLIKISPAYFDGLSAEKSSYEQIAKAVQNYNDGIAKTAEIKALLPEFEGMFQKVIKLQVELNQLKRFQGGAFGLPEEEFKQQSKAITDQIRGITNEIKVAKEALSGIAGGSLQLQEILFGKQDKPAPKEKIIKAAKEHAKAYTETLQHAINEFLKDGILPEDLGKKLKAKIDPNIGQLHLTPELQAQLNALEEAQAKLAKMETFVSGILSPAFDELFKSIADGSTNAFEAFGQALKNIISQLAVTIAKAAALAAIFSIITPTSKGGLGFVGNFLKILGFAEGGEVKGRGSSTSDSIPARLSAGEYVIKAATVKQFGVGFFDKINKGGGPNLFGSIPKFAAGGFVSPSLGSIGGGQQIFIAQSVIRGQDIVTSFHRATGTINRNS